MYFSLIIFSLPFSYYVETRSLYSLLGCYEMHLGETVSLKLKYTIRAEKLSDDLMIIGTLAFRVCLTFYASQFLYLMFFFLFFFLPSWYWSLWFNVRWWPYQWMVRGWSVAMDWVICASSITRLVASSLALRLCWAMVCDDANHEKCRFYFILFFFLSLIHLFIYLLFYLFSYLCFFSSFSIADC
jgi:hypothetical protein